VVQEGIDGLSDTDWSEDSRAKQRVATESVVENILGSGNVSVHPGQIRQLFESKGGDGAFVTFSDPFEREVVAVGIQWVWRREGVKARLGETPEECVSFEVKRSAFPISVRPALRPPNNV
jgi:hypothetical protein